MRRAASPAAPGAKTTHLAARMEQAARPGTVLIAPAEVMDTASFYEEYWLRPKGKYLLQVCRSLSCEICGSRQITEHLRDHRAVEIGAEAEIFGIHSICGHGGAP